MISAQHCMASKRAAAGRLDHCPPLPSLPGPPPPLSCHCRRASLYVPWKCEHERHSYEKCQYKDYKRRVQQAAEQQQSA
jgi:hypothetical protein